MPVKASVPTVQPLGTRSQGRDEQKRKAESPMDVNAGGRLVRASEVQPRKAAEGRRWMSRGRKTREGQRGAAAEGMSAMDRRHSGGRDS